MATTDALSSLLPGEMPAIVDWKDLPGIPDRAPSSGFRVRGAAGTRPGKGRAHNQDAWLVCPTLDLAVVADGMGAYAESQAAVRALQEALANADPNGTGDAAAQMEAAIHNAHTRLNRGRRIEPDQDGSGTTLAAAWLVDGWVVVAHVGDSRVYLLRDGELRRLTEDNSRLEQVPAPGTLRHFGGVIDPGSMQLAIGTFEVGPGDRLLVCTDGVSDAVAEDRLRTLLEVVPEASRAVQTVLDAATARGSEDDRTAVVVDIGEPRPT